MLLTLAGSTMGCGGDAETGPPPPPDVGVAQPIKRDVTVFSEHLGSTQAFESVEVQARVTGELEQITFQPSTIVQEGEQLFVIEPRQYKAERDAADAALKSAEAELARAESDLKRVEQAVKTNAVSESDVDLARAERDMARASVLSAEAALDRAELQLSYTQVRSPITGQVGRNLVDRGNIVSGSQRTVLTTVNRMQPMFVYFEAPEEVVLRALQNLDLTTVIDIESEGAQRETTFAEVATLIDDDFPFSGPIDYVSNTVDTATGTIQLRAVLPNEEMRLFPGLFVRVRIPMDLLEDAVLIREEALGTDLGGRYVYVVGDDNIVERRYVQLGVVEPDGMVPILEGLDGSETYIVNGLLRARPGMPVTPEQVADTNEAKASRTPSPQQEEVESEPATDTAAGAAEEDS
ncbi:MAG: efflux RND transporter periplasmic adaptor subunit [Thermoanaerobaculia bacterium]